MGALTWGNVASSCRHSFQTCTFSGVPWLAGLASSRTLPETWALRTDVSACVGLDEIVMKQVGAQLTKALAYTRRFQTMFSSACRPAQTHAFHHFPLRKQCFPQRIHHFPFKPCFPHHIPLKISSYVFFKRRSLPQHVPLKHHVF